MIKTTTLELRVPPIVILVLFMVLMWLMVICLPYFTVDIAYQSIVSAILACAGVVVSLLGAVTFINAKTSVNPLAPGITSSLVTTGVYRYSRNPMYIGFLLMLVGWGVFLSNWVAFILPVGFVFYINHYQIKPEERILESLFGTAYLSYKHQVRRWL